MQEKIDGRFMCISNLHSVVVARNKLGHKVKMPLFLQDFLNELPGTGWKIYGELVKDKYYVFEIAHSDLELFEGNFCQDLELFNVIVDTMGRSDIKVLIPIREIAEKIARFVVMMDSDCEGVVFTWLGPGESALVRNKFKFYKTVDAIVIGKNVDGKQACELGVFDDGKLVSIGKVGVSRNIIKKMTPTQVVEVRYRKLSGAGKLIEPTFIRRRNDKLAIDCSYNQFIVDRIWQEEALVSSYYRDRLRDMDIDFDVFWELINRNEDSEMNKGEISL